MTKFVVVNIWESAITYDLEIMEFVYETYSAVSSHLSRYQKTVMGKRLHIQIRWNYPWIMIFTVQSTVKSQKLKNTSPKNEIWTGCLSPLTCRDIKAWIPRKIIFGVENTENMANFLRYALNLRQLSRRLFSTSLFELLYKALVFQNREERSSIVQISGRSTFRRDKTNVKKKWPSF